MAKKKKKARKKAARSSAPRKKTSSRKKKKSSRKVKSARRKSDSPSSIPVVPDLGSGGHGHGHGHAVAISTEREAMHAGCHIRVKTTYEISVNGQPFAGHVVVGNDGQMYTHACPYTDFPSAIDMMKHLVDVYPEFFTPCGHDAEHPAPEIHLAGGHS